MKCTRPGNSLKVVIEGDALYRSKLVSAPQPLVVRARQHPIERGERFADAVFAAEALAEREREPWLFAIGLGYGPSQAWVRSPVTTLL